MRKGFRGLHTRDLFRDWFMLHGLDFVRVRLLEKASRKEMGFLIGVHERVVG